MNDGDRSQWTIRPHQGVGILDFGTSRADTRILLGGPTSTFKKGPFETGLADAYDQIGLHLNFDLGDLLESVDAWGPSTITFDGLLLLKVDSAELVGALRKRGFEHRNFIYFDLGFAVFVDEGLVRGVTAFPKGYWDLSNPDSAASRANRAAEAFLRAKLAT